MKIFSKIFLISFIGICILVTTSGCDMISSAIATTTTTPPSVAVSSPSTTTTTSPAAETTTPIETTVPTTTTSTTTISTNTSSATTTTVTGNLTVHFIDVGQGDAILLDCGTTEVLIDAGDGSPDIVPYLTPLVDGCLEVMIATHIHADHIGGLDEVLAGFDVGELWQSGEIGTTKTYQRYIKAAINEGCKVYDAHSGDSITAGPLTFTVLHPTEIGDDTNNNSVVVWLTYGQIDFLFMGDAEVESEAEMLAASVIPVPDIELLKVGHHASRTASSHDFLFVMNPKVAIYMCALDNSYGHPHEETITALQDIGAEIYGTENYGTIIVTCNGTCYTVEPELPKW